ncbi:MAG: tRNA pseudouridine(55) synthase TruB [Polyangiaceae bacterium]
MAGSGVLVVDKPQGPTSHDVVRTLRKALGTRAVGHCGTLDPMATGVLVVAIEEGTKLVPWLTAGHKAYEATLALCVETDTFDAEGRVVRRDEPDPTLLAALAASSPSVPGDALALAFAAERARTSQVPPAFSAVRKDGVRAMDRARRGEAVDLEARDVRLLRIDLLGCRVDPPSMDIAIEATKGYYVRALARDLAAALGTCGHVTALRRTRSGTFGLAEAVSLDAPPAELASRIVPLPLAAARALPVAHLTEAGEREARHGRPVPPAEMDVQYEGDAAWLSPDGQLVAIGRIDAGQGRVVRGMAR